MTPEHEHFADLATRTLDASPDLREEARAEVLGRLAHGRGGIEDATARLESKRPRAWWKSGGWGMVALVALAVWAALLARQGVSETRQLHGVILFGVGLDYEDRLRESLDPAVRDFVYAGIGSDAEVVANLQRQWELHPDELGIYEELAHRSLALRQELPPGFAETWRRMDPGNGLWYYLEAVGKNEEWKRSGPPAGETHSREVIHLLRQSAAAPRFTSYLPELRNRRLSHFPPAGTLAVETEQFLFTISALWAPAVRYEREAVLVYGKAAQQAVAEKDAVELAVLIASWERFIGRLAASRTTMLEFIVPASGWNETGKILLQASRDLGLREQELRLDELGLEFAAYQSAWRGTAVDPRPMSSLARVLYVRSLEPLDPLLFAPGLHAEYALVDRMTGLAMTMVVLVFLTGVLIESIRRGRRVNGLADGLGTLFRTSDFLWVAGLGIVLPVAWYLGITRGTPLGLRDIGFSHYKPQPALIQAGAALVFALLMTVRVVRGRLAARAGYLALVPARPWVGWTMAGIAAAVIPLAGGVRWLSGNEERYLQAVAATGGLPLLWLLWEAGSVAFASRDQALGGVLLCRRMMPPLALLAALPLACWTPLLSAERHWHARDPISRANREHGGMSIGEARATQEMRARILVAFPSASGAPAGTPSALTPD